MAELTTLARPYAVAAFRRAKETGNAEQWVNALGFVAALMEDPQVAQAVANPKADRRQFEQAFIGLCQENLDFEAQNFVRLLIQNRRLGLIKHIAALFGEFKADDEGYINVNVASAYPLEPEEQDKIAGVLARALGRTPKINVSVDPSLIGGLFISAGDRVIDASVRGQVERLAKRLCN